MIDVVAIAAQVRASRGLAHKVDIAPVVAALGLGSADAVPIGDDAAVLPGGDESLLIAMEGLVEDFIAADPWFAGYCGVMVNVSDVLAMGGRPIAVVNAFWADGMTSAAPLLQGMRDAARRYRVPIVGGHSNLRSGSTQLAVAILGRAEQVVTSFDARPGDTFLMACDLEGRFRDPFPWWDASTGATDAHLLDLLEIMPELARHGRLSAAKDISMGGPLGTAIMLAESSRVGLDIDLDAIPRPAGVPWERWLSAFPSFGFILTSPPDQAEAIIGRFARSGVACSVVGTVTACRDIVLRSGDSSALLWAGDERLIGCHSMLETIDA